MNVPLNRSTHPVAAAPMALRELLPNGCADVPELIVSGLGMDSRQLAAGELFVAVAGTRTHGLAHLAQARARGAAAVAWEPAPGVVPPDAGTPAVAVPALGQQIGSIAARFYRQPSRDLFVTGVTGTDGKTSTAHLIAQGLDALGVPCGYLGTIGYGRLDQLDDASHTTPDAIRVQQRLAGLRAMGVRACAMEVSSHALDQHRVGGIEFGAAVLTNVGRDHLDYHGDVETYAAAKRRLFSDCAPRHAVLNRDDAYGARWANELQAAGVADVTVYGLEGGSPASGHAAIAQQLSTHPAGLRIEVLSDGGAARLESRLLGRFNAANLLAALAVLLRQGAPLDEAVAVLAAARTVPGRMEAFRVAGDATAPTIVVDYAHTPQALTAALQALRPHVQGRLLCVFGCGGDRDRGKRPLMGAAAAQLADAAIVTDDNPRSEAPPAIVTEILAGVPNALRDRLTVEHDRGAAIRRAVAAAGAGDVVLIAGKGHERDQESQGVKRPFSDRALVAELCGETEFREGSA